MTKCSQALAHLPRNSPTRQVAIQAALVPYFKVTFSPSPFVLHKLTLLLRLIDGGPWQVSIQALATQLMLTVASARRVVRRLQAAELLMVYRVSTSSGSQAANVYYVNRSTVMRVVLTNPDNGMLATVLCSMFLHRGLGSLPILSSAVISQDKRDVHYGIGHPGSESIPAMPDGVSSDETWTELRYELADKGFQRVDEVLVLLQGFKSDPAMLLTAIRFYCKRCRATCTRIE